jgi:hypothetical protein
MSRRRNKPGEVYINPRAPESGRLLGILLRTYGYNTRTAAEKLGVTENLIRMYIRGNAPIPPASLERIFDKLEAPKLAEMEAAEKAAMDEAIGPEP